MDFIRPATYLPLGAFAVLSVFTMCSSSPKTSEKEVATAVSSPAETVQGVTTKEDFEAGKKGKYEKEEVKLSSGTWRFDDALIGSTDEDHKAGKQAVRIREKGRITMLFDLTTGVSSVTIRHAAYGDDESSDWELWYSTSQGKNWQSAGPKVSAAQGSLNTMIFPLSSKGSVRFEVRKVSGGKSRLNLDDFTVVPFGSKVKIEEKPATPPAQPPVAKAKPGKSPSDPTALYLLLGNPSKATADQSNADNFLMEKRQFTLSYNRSRGLPNWVSWYIDKSWLGKVDRQNNFHPDPELPNSWPHVTPTDYSGSGFDKGHMCPSSDRQKTVEDNTATFLMTNMVPQSPDNNQGPWKDMEEESRRMVREEGKELYIIAGTYGVGGEGSNGKTNKLKGKVTVPAHTWKVMVVLPNGDNDLSRIDAKTRVIAIDIPNKQGIKNDSWTKYKTSVDAIEKATGYDLLSNVPKAVQDVLEKKVD